MVQYYNLFYISLFLLFIYLLSKTLFIIKIYNQKKNRYNMYIRSISPIIATILIIVITVAIAVLFYAFTSGIFNSIISSSNNLVNQQSKVISFTINNVYCSNNIVYFDIYNNGNIPININNSIIIFTDNNGNTISINGSNIICNNGNIIPSGNSKLCYLNWYYSCYYNYTDYIKSMNFIYNGISYSYNILSNNKFNLIYNLSNYPIIIYNTQNIPTPSPFQQDIAICNGNPGIGPNFAYINNATLFNQINPNGQNVLFFNPNNGQLLYSWYEGQLNYNGVTCDVWWVKLPNGIPANSNVTIYMYIGPNSANYYQQYYPYAGEAPQLFSTYGQYDNGNYVFYYYSNTSNTAGWTISGAAGVTVSPPASSVSSFGGYAFYADQTVGDYMYIQLPSNVPTNNVIIEYYFYTTRLGDLYFYVNSNGAGQMSRAGCGSTWYGIAPTSSWTSWNTPSGNGNYCNAWYLVGVVVNGSTAIEYITSGNMFYGLEIGQNPYTYSGVSINGNYIGLVGDANGGSQASYWMGIIIRALPPNGVMPSIYIS